MNRLAIALFVVFFAFTSAVSAQGQFGFDEMLAQKRVGDPQLSPDGRTIAFTIGVVNKAENRTLTQIYTINVDGSNQKQLTSGDRSNSSPRWSPDGKHIAYTSGGQIWVMENDGDHKDQLSKISSGAGQPVWSPDGKWIMFASEVYPECKTDECNQAEDTRVGASKVQAKVTTRLLYRHWVEWRDRKRSHVYVVSSKGGTAWDVTPGDADSPPYAAASGTDYAFSPDSTEIAVMRNPDAIEAISTNSDIYIMPLPNISRKAPWPTWETTGAKNITITNRGYDASPMYTPDGKYILYRSQKTEGFEADRWRIMRYDRKSGETVELTRGFDQQVDEMTLSPDGKTIYFVAGEAGRSPIFRVPLEPDMRLRIATFVEKVVDKVAAGSLNVTPDGSTLIFTSSSMTAPAEIMRASTSGGVAERVTGANTPLRLAAAEDVQWKGALNAAVHGWILKPANFDSSKRYPLLVLIHGGPQGAWSDNWGYRWNPQVFANAGYIVLMPNPRGSTGYGQEFVNGVSGDWGGKAIH